MKLVDEKDCLSEWAQLVCDRCYDEPKPETYEAVVAAKTIIPCAMKKLLAESLVRAPDYVAQPADGILVETVATGFYLVTPGPAAPAG